MTRDTRRRLFWLTLFTVAMAHIEATVVVYLRELFYPDGFQFPLVVIPNRLGAIEIAREVGTVLMLLGVAKLFSARDSWRQYAAFLYAFGLWDIFYYVWLWVMLRWPSTLLDWDVLFLIPVPWIGPVLAPLLVAGTMLLAALLILRLRDLDLAIRVRPQEWVLVVGCAIGLIVVFCWDAGRVLRGEMPGPFAWSPFAMLLALAAGVSARVWRRALASGC